MFQYLPYSFKHLSQLRLCDEKMTRAVDCWLHGQVVVHQHFLDIEQTSYTKHVLLVS